MEHMGMVFQPFLAAPPSLNHSKDGNQRHGPKPKEGRSSMAQSIRHVPETKRGATQPGKRWKKTDGKITIFNG